MYYWPLAERIGEAVRADCGEVSRLFDEHEEFTAAYVAWRRRRRRRRSAGGHGLTTSVELLGRHVLEAQIQITLVCQHRQRTLYVLHTPCTQKYSQHFVSSLLPHSVHHINDGMQTKGHEDKRPPSCFFHWRNVKSPDYVFTYLTADETQSVDVCSPLVEVK